MKKTVIRFSAFVSLALATSCNSKSLEMVDQIETTYAYHDKTIELEGYLAPPRLTMIGDVVAMNLKVYKTLLMLQLDEKILRNVGMKHEQGKNSVFINIPEGKNQYKDSDVTIFDKDGNKITVSDKVKVTARVVYPHKGAKKVKSPIKFSALKNVKDDEGEDYSYNITDVVVEKL